MAGPFNLFPDQFPADKQYPQATITLQTVLDDLKEMQAKTGMQISVSAVSHYDANSKSYKDTAISPGYGLQPGDTIEFKGPQGRVWISRVNADATDYDPPTQTAGPEGPEAPASIDYSPSPAELAKDPVQAWADAVAKARANGNQKDITDATAKYQAALDRKQSEDIAAKNRQATQDAANQKAFQDTLAGEGEYQQARRSGTTPSATALLAHQKYIQSQGGGGGTGTASTSPVAQAIDAITTDPRVRMAMKLGASLEGGMGSTYGAGDGGMSWGPFQINHNNGMHANISRADSEDPMKASQYMLAEYQAAVDKVDPALWQSNPKQAAAQAAYYAERPAQMYPGSRIDSGWAQVTGNAGTPTGDTLPGPRPVPTNFGTSTNPDWRIYDPGSGRFVPAPGAPTTGVTSPSTQATTDLNEANAAKIRQELLPKSQLAMQQYAQTIDYVKTQLANGTITLDEANNYQQSASSVLNASLQGTTPFDLQKLAQEQATQRAQIGKDLIDQKLQSGASLASSLVQSADTGLKAGWGSYNPLTYARLLTDQRAGGPQMDSLAKSLVQALQPNGGTASPTPGGPMPPSISGLPGQNLSPGPGGLPLLGPALGGAPPPALGSVLPPSPGGTPQTLTPPGMPPPGPTPAPMGWPNPQQTSSDLVAA